MERENVTPFSDFTPCFLCQPAVLCALFAVFVESSCAASWLPSPRGGYRGPQPSYTMMGFMSVLLSFFLVDTFLFAYHVNGCPSCCSLPTPPRRAQKSPVTSLLQCCCPCSLPGRFPSVSCFSCVLFFRYLVFHAPMPCSLYLNYLAPPGVPLCCFTDKLVEALGRFLSTGVLSVFFLVFLVFFFFFLTSVFNVQKKKTKP